MGNDGAPSLIYAGVAQSGQGIPVDGDHLRGHREQCAVAGAQQGRSRAENQSAGLLSDHRGIASRPASSLVGCCCLVGTEERLGRLDRADHDGEASTTSKEGQQ